MANEQPTISVRKIQVLQLAFVILFSLATALFYSIEITGAVLVGGVISFLSFLWLERDIKNIFHGPMKASKILFFIKYYARLALLAVVLYLVIKNRIFNVLGLLVGLSTVMLSIIFTGIGEIKKMHINVKEAA